MKKNKFIFNLGEHVFFLGRPGRCVITGRGTMEFASGGTCNMYQVSGGHNDIVTEHILITPAEMKAIIHCDSE